MIDWDIVLLKTPEAYEAFADAVEREGDTDRNAWWFRHQAKKLRVRAELSKAA